MFIKPGVKLDRLKPQMVLAYVIVLDLFTHNKLITLITSGNEFEESRLTFSLHYEGHALDFRSKIIPREDLDYIVNALIIRLGDNYDVVLKHRGEENEHLHIEFDPKPRVQVHA